MSARAREIQIEVGDFSVSASVHGAGETAIVLGHGAGGNRHSPQLWRVAEALARAGRRAVLYNFRYSEQGRKAPDRTEILERTTRAVGEHVSGLSGVERVVHGGRSMGGRIASQVVASGAPAAGLLLLAYPLHPPGRPERLRDTHLSEIRVPMLFVQGTRDAFARPDLLEATLKRLGRRATLESLAEADHSFKVPKRTGSSPEQVERQIHDAVLSWLDRCGL
jgi:predicted alpha/beta-hydrolase family hydrolase